MEFHNPGYFLKPGMFATVELAGGAGALGAAGAGHGGAAQRREEHGVCRAGGRQVRAAHGRARARRRRTTLYQVLSGLNEGERIVTSGQFMLDSESQLREAIQKMMRAQAPSARSAEHAGHGHGSAGDEPRQRQRPRTDNVYHLPDAGARFHRIRSPGQMSPLRHDAGAGDAARPWPRFSPAASCCTTPARCPSTATCMRQAGQVPASAA